MPKTTKQAPVLDRRRTGVLLHPTSLPGGIGCGDLGPESYHFVDFLENCGVSVWQVLPLGPTHEDRSPYMSLSVMAGNPEIISLQRLNEWGWLKHDCVDFPGEGDPFLIRQECLQQAYQGFVQHAGSEDRRDYEKFIQQHQYWLDDFALFQAIRGQQKGKAWTDWPAPLRDRQAQALNTFRKQHEHDINQTRFEQYVFFRQWHGLRDYANEKGILIFGDMPIFVAHDSAEVWANRQFFDIDKTGHPRTIAGVPPDYFSVTGQRWGNPHYDWKAMKEDGFSWWIKRLRGTLELFDLVRIDHFRGFESYWEIKADAETAINGRWVKTPGRALFNVLLENLGQLPFIAEDLGTITPAVDALRNKYGWPGMKILQFAFDGNTHNPYLPHNYEPNCVVYTGTHDNDTTLGWYSKLSDHDQLQVAGYLGYDIHMPWSFVRCALASVAKLAVLPMQDLLGLDHHHRMNTPGTDSGNWQWRFEWTQVDEDMPAKLRTMIEQYARE